MPLEPALHLWINHLPFFLIVFGMALVFTGLFLEVEPHIKLGLICLMAASFFAILSYRTGPLLAEMLGYDLQSSTQTPAGKHALYGFPANLSAILVGVFSLLTLWMSRGKLRIERVWLGFVLLGAVLAIAVNGVAYFTGKQLAHPVLTQPSGTIEVAE